MALERTLSIVKPDGVTRNLIGEVVRRLERAGLKVVGSRMLRLSKSEATIAMPRAAASRPRASLLGPGMLSARSKRE